MNKKLLSVLSIGILILFLSSVIVVLPAQAEPQENVTEACPTTKQVQNWTGLDQMGAHGFYDDSIGEVGTLTFDSEEPGFKFLSLDLGTTTTFDPVASRITEIDVSVPVSERTKCWQPTASENVTAEFMIRFDQAQTPGLTENVLLWNAPFGDNTIPLSAFGVTRNPILLDGTYMAIIAQDAVFNLEDGTVDGLLTLMPLVYPAPWLDPTDWHTVRMTVTETDVLIEVSQGEHGFTPALYTILDHAPEPLGFEFSIDNDIIVAHLPVVAPDSLDVGLFDMRMVQVH